MKKNNVNVEDHWNSLSDEERKLWGLSHLYASGEANVLHFTPAAVLPDGTPCATYSFYLIDQKKNILSEFRNADYILGYLDRKRLQDAHDHTGKKEFLNLILDIASETQV